MIDAATLASFSLAVLLLLLSPGPNIAFVLLHGARYGLRGGIAAAAGIGAADLVLTGLTAGGITALVAAWPYSYDLIRYAGVVYLMNLARMSLRRPAPDGAPQGTPLPLAVVAVRAMLNALLNPKALLFFMVFLPQFVTPARGAVTLQLLELGAVLSAIALLFNTMLGAFSGAALRLLAGHGCLARLQPYAVALVLTALALRLAITRQPL